MAFTTPPTVPMPLNEALRRALPHWDVFSEVPNYPGDTADAYAGFDVDWEAIYKAVNGLLVPCASYITGLDSLDFLAEVTPIDWRDPIAIQVRASRLPRCIRFDRSCSRRPRPGWRGSTRPC
jgi:hypothetical protein